MSVPASAISRITGVDVAYKNFNIGQAQMLPQRLAVIGQGSDSATYTTEKFEVESAIDVAERFGYGSPLHLAIRQLFPLIGKGASFPVTIYPLQKATSAVAATSSIGATGTATASGSGKIHIGGVDCQFAVAKGDTGATVLAAIKAAIDGELDMPCTTGTIADDAIPLTSKASGTVGNLIKIWAEINAPGITFAITNFASGALDPDVATALTAIGEVWETAILSCFPYNDQDRLDDYYAWGTERWGYLNKKPCIVFHGCTDNYATRSAVTDQRPNDRINALVQATGSPELPYVIGAKAMVFDILTTADSNPAQGYKGLLEGLKAGADSAQETYLTRNMSVTKGASTSIKNGNETELNDVITMFHPANQGKYPGWRYVVDAMKLMNVVYNVRLIMEADELKGAPLLPDSAVTSNKSAVQPKMIKSYFITLAQSLEKKAILADANFSKENMTVKIDSENPKRLNVEFPCKLSGNIEVSSTDIYFGFYLGED